MFSGDGFLVKKTALLDVGCFNEKLEVAEDTELWSKLSLKFKLQYGNLKEPVAKRGVHDTNIFYNKKKYTKPRLLIYISLLKFAIQNNASELQIKLIISKLLNRLPKYARRNVLKYCKYWFISFFYARKRTRNKVFWLQITLYSKTTFLYYLRKVQRKIKL